MENKGAPKDWLVVRLGDIASITTGKKDVNEGAADGKYPFFTCSQKEHKINDYSFDTEAILVAGNAYFNIKYYKGKFDAYQRTYVIDGFKDNAGQYLYYVLSKDLAGLTTNNQGSAVKYIKLGDLTNFEMLLPPFKERQKIINILLTVDSVIDQTQAVIDQTQTLKKGLMQELFTCGIPGRHKKFKKTELGEIPEEWDVVKLQDIASVERGKFQHRPRNEPRFYGGKYPFVQTGDVTMSGGRIKTYSQTLNEEGLAISRLFPKGTILITIAANIGETAIAEFPVAFPDSLIGIIVKDQVSNIFLEYYFRTKKMHLNKVATESAQKNINLETLKPFPVPLPSKQEQEMITKMFEAVELRELYEANFLMLLKNFKSALMQVLLTGEARVMS